MSMTLLQELVRKTILELGKGGKEKFAVKAGISFSTLGKFRKGTYSGDTAYKVALACGLNKDEAFTLAREASTEAKESA